MTTQAQQDMLDHLEATDYALGFTPFFTSHTAEDIATEMAEEESEDE